MSRSNLPPALYKRYHDSLLRYLNETKKCLDSATSALDAACHAVSLMEDDELFNCGRGSVFTTQGTIEMEASVMVASVGSEAGENMQGGTKRAAAVSLIRNTRHPILLAREVLLDADADGGLGGTSKMHCHLSGKTVEEWGWKDKNLERKDDDWFWTRRRWEEHRRGLMKKSHSERKEEDRGNGLCEKHEVVMGMDLPSQGTVGAVALDSWGNIAVATSTGGLTNKAPGRIGDTPSIGAGFWAESWDEQIFSHEKSEHEDGLTVRERLGTLLQDAISEAVDSCLPSLSGTEGYTRTTNVDDNLDRKPNPSDPSSSTLLPKYTSTCPPTFYRPKPPPSRLAVAMSGTGNGDSFLRLNAVRTAAAISRFSFSPSPRGLDRGISHPSFKSNNSYSRPKRRTTAFSRQQMGEDGRGSGWDYWD